MRHQVLASVGPPAAAFSAPETLTSFVPAVSAPAVAAAGDEAFAATAVENGPVTLATRAAGASTITRRSLSSAGDGDVLLAAGGPHVLAAFQRHDRLRLVVVR